MMTRELDPATLPNSPSMNGEHALQVNLLGALRDAVAEGRSHAGVDEVLDQLLDFTKVHFASEEMLMRLYSYDGHDAHVREHEHAIEQVEKIRDRYRAGDHVLSLETVDSLGRWILTHTQRADRALGAFLGEMRETVG